MLASLRIVSAATVFCAGHSSPCVIILAKPLILGEVSRWLTQNLIDCVSLSSLDSPCAKCRQLNATLYANIIPYYVLLRMRSLCRREQKFIFRGIVCDEHESRWRVNSEYSTSFRYQLVVDRRFDRNARKCSSAHSLWLLQEPLRRKRWSSGEGEAAWSSLSRHDRFTKTPRLRESEAIGSCIRHQEYVLQELVWAGVPAGMREEVYMFLSGKMFGIVQYFLFPTILVVQA